MIEARRYGPELSDEDRRAILERVTSPQARLVVYRELSVQSPFTVEIMHARLEELAVGWDRFVLVLDLATATRPDAATRAELRCRVSRIANRVQRLAVVIGDNIVMAAMVRFLAYSMGYKSVSVHRSLEEATREAQRVLGA